MKMDFKQRLRDYLARSGRWKIVSDGLFWLFVIAMLIPVSRREMMTLAQRLMMRNPVIERSENYVDVGAISWPLKSMHGERLDFSSLKGRVILINQWATWCPPCRAEMPALEALYQEYGAKGLVILAVSQEERDVLLEFITEKGYTLPVYQGLSAVPAPFETSSIAATWLIDSHGVIHIADKGARKWNSETVKQLVDTLLKEAALSH